MKLIYIYHSCYCIETKDATILIDFYKDTKDIDGMVYKEILPRAKKLYVLGTHSHLDHYNSEVLNWKRKLKDITYIFSKEILDSGMGSKNDGHYLDKLGEYRDENIFVKTYGSTDVGASIYLEIEGKRIFHAGDLNNWHWNQESSLEEIKEAEDFYSKELDLLANDIRQLDIVMFPIDPRLGKDFMKGATQLLDAIDVKLLAPLHFEERYDKLIDFVPIAKEYDCQYMLIKEKGQTINI